MKILCSTVLILFGASVLFAGTPTLDGIFDGTEIWGAAVSTADGVAGWNGANAKRRTVYHF